MILVIIYIYLYIYTHKCIYPSTHTLKCKILISRSMNTLNYTNYYYSQSKLYFHRILHTENNHVPQQYSYIPIYIYKNNIISIIITSNHHWSPDKYKINLYLCILKKCEYNFDVKKKAEKFMAEAIINGINYPLNLVKLTQKTDAEINSKSKREKQTTNNNKKVKWICNVRNQRVAWREAQYECEWAMSTRTALRQHQQPATNSQQPAIEKIARKWKWNNSTCSQHNYPHSPKFHSQLPKRWA